MNTTGTVTHQSKNPHVRKHLHGGPMTALPMQKNKGAARHRRTLSNRGQGTRPAPPIKIPRTKHGYYPLREESY